MSRGGTVSPRTLAAEDIARYCRVNQATVEAWIAGGELRSFEAYGGARRITLDDFRAFLRLQGLPVDALFFHNGGRTKTVLLVSDDSGWARTVARTLCESSVALHVVTASDCQEAHCQVTASCPDVIILGRHVHRDQDFGLCLVLGGRKRERSVRILALRDGCVSVWDQPEVRERVDLVVPQDSGPADLRGAVRELLLRPGRASAEAMGIPQRMQRL
jgi:hypothetical protein